MKVLYAVHPKLTNMLNIKKHPKQTTHPPQKKKKKSQKDNREVGSGKIVD